jgi:hypothetical protein
VLAASFSKAMMEAASTFEKSVNFYQTTRRNKPKDSHRCHENLKSHYKPITQQVSHSLLDNQ